MKTLFRLFLLLTCDSAAAQTWKIDSLYLGTEKLMQAELENAHLHEKQLHDELENRAKSLTAHTLSNSYCCKYKNLCVISFP